MLNILLVEDDHDLAATVVEYLELEKIRCDHASNGQRGLQLAQENNYDALLLDLNLPRLDGLSLCQQLRAVGNDIPVLMLTARDQLQDKLDGFRSGTDDYLVKPFALSELTVRIQALTRRRSGQARILNWNDISMDLDQHTVSRANQPIKVSPIGWQLLELLLRAAPAAVSKQKLEQTVWGDDIPDSNTLKVHMHHLRKALDNHFEQAAIATVSGYGFVLNPEHVST